MYSDSSALLRAPGGIFILAELTKGGDGRWWAVSLSSSNAVAVLPGLRETALALTGAPDLLVRERAGDQGAAPAHPPRRR